MPNSWVPVLEPKGAAIIPITCVYSAKEWKLTDKKTSKEMKAFDGVSNYKNWAERVREHCMSVNAGWIRLLFFMQRESRQLNWAFLSQTTFDTLGGHHLVELSSFLWCFLGHVMTDAIHPRRVALAGGEESNGFELWRRLRWEQDG